MSYDAVPQLIEALEDQRFTRSVGFHRNFYFSHYLLRVGDCAQSILREIAGQSFWQSRSTFSYMSMDGGTAETKKKAQAWYGELQRKGEKRLLIEGTERGDTESATPRLVQRYPEVAWPVISSCIRAAKHSYPRRALVYAGAQLKSDEPLPFLLQEVRNGPFLGSRRQAAEALRSRGRPEGVQAMIAEWQAQRPKTNRKLGSQDTPDWEQDIRSIAEFLARCGRVEAIKALAKDLQNWPLGVRETVISSFREIPNTGPAGMPGTGDRDANKDPEKIHTAVTDLLVAALDDTEEVGMSGTMDGKLLADPRICDLAAHELRQREPDRYPFDPSALLTTRDRSIVELKNVWRKAHGLALLPVPGRKTIVAIASNRVQPLLDEFLSAPDPDESDAASRIERLGLGTLPAIQERLAKTDENDLPRVALQGLAGRVACIVDQVAVKGAVKADGALSSKLEAMKGKCFDPKAFVHLIRLAASSLPAGAWGLRVDVTREGDGTGMTLTLSFLDEAQATGQRLGRSGRSKPRDGRPAGWNYGESVKVGAEARLGLTGGSVGPECPVGDKDSMLHGALRSVCAADPSEPIEIKVWMRIWAQ